MKYIQYCPLLPSASLNFWNDDDDSMLWSLLAPSLKRRKMQHVAQKFRVACDCRGFSPESIKAELAADGKKLVVSGREKNGDDEQYTLNEFRRKFDVPDNADTSKLKSFMTPAGLYVIEMPLNEVDEQPEDDDHDEDLFPKIVDNKETGVKEVRMCVQLPKGLDPAKVQVTVKDHVVIVQADQDNLFYTKRSSMPKECDIESLKCLFDSKRGNRLVLSAPINKTEKENNGWKPVPIQMATTAETKTTTEAA